MKHGCNLYSWSQHEEGKIENPDLHFIAETDGNDLHMTNNEQFFFVKHVLNSKNEKVGQTIIAVKLNYSFYF